MDSRLSFQESMRLVPLPSRGSQDDEKGVRRFMSVRAPWLPTSDLREFEGIPSDLKLMLPSHRAAHGGHVYCQCGMAAARVLRESDAVQGTDASQYGLHTMHGYWSEMGLVDRPFIYEVTPLSTTRLFINTLVVARQPISPSSSPSKDHYPLSDAELPLGPVCFSSVVSFRLPETSQSVYQESSAQTRFASILASRAPEEWVPAPPLDIDAFTQAIPRDFVGTFPVVDMKKVDMRAFNADKPIHERRELILYRLLTPLSADDPSAHVMVHAYESDRNGFLMISNHAGYGFEFGKVASLSNSIVVHTNPDGAVMKGDGWWIQEVLMPRMESGRGLLHSKIWSPEGVHVASCFQDGICRKHEPRRKKGGKGKL